MKNARDKFSCVQSPRLEANREPLYKRLPTHDENGNHLSDFMMLIPGLKQMSAPLFEARLALLHGLLGEHKDVVFVDLNTPLNLLWISVRARHGVISEIAAEIRRHIPEARLVGHTPLIGPEKPAPHPARRALRWFAATRLRLRLGKPR